MKDTGSAQVSQLMPSGVPVTASGQASRQRFSTSRVRHRAAPELQPRCHRLSLAKIDGRQDSPLSGGRMRRIVHHASPFPNSLINRGGLGCADVDVPAPAVAARGVVGWVGVDDAHVQGRGTPEHSHVSAAGAIRLGDCRSRRRSAACAGANGATAYRRCLTSGSHRQSWHMDQMTSP